MDFGIKFSSIKMFSFQQVKLIKIKIIHDLFLINYLLLFLYFHSLTLLFEINLVPSVNKILSSCDDIIRQHKSACLRVNALLACKDLVWVGTSAGIILTISMDEQERGSINNYNNVVIDQPLVSGEKNSSSNIKTKKRSQLNSI